MPRRPRILFGCECSGVGRRAFAAKGWDSWSCDLKEPEDGSPNHICGDLLDVLEGDWDVGVFHPPCDYLTVSGNRWFSEDARAAEGILTGKAREAAQHEALTFVRRLWGCAIPRVALENPIGRLSSLWMRPTQVIQPFHFGAPHRKATCLWLRGLPRLIPSHVAHADLFAERQPAVIAATVHRMPPGPNRKADRSRTYPEIAAAMADQWGKILGFPS